jgi:hypothetical protein
MEDEDGTDEDCRTYDRITDWAWDRMNSGVCFRIMNRCIQNTYYWNSDNGKTFGRSTSRLTEGTTTNRSEKRMEAMLELVVNRNKERLEFQMD